VSVRPELAELLPGASGVLFLCSGNMVRSAFADLYARHREAPVPVSSAATVYRNDRMLEETAQALRARGVAEGWIAAFRPRHLADVIDELDGDTLVLAMTRQHRLALARRPELRARAFLLEELRGAEVDVEDPVLDGADFALTFERIARCVDVLVAALAARRVG